MKKLRALLIVMFGLLSVASWAQDPELEGRLEEEALTEAVVAEEGTETLLLDNTRSKIGRDFYEAFFRHYVELPKAVSPAALADTTLKITPKLELDINAFIVTIDELPAFGIGTSIISVSLNDQVVWQNYVQIRQEILEQYAFNAAEVVNQYVLNYQEVQRSLENEDQKGSGIF
jgi:UDP-galactopyranose mutase